MVTRYIVQSCGLGVQYNQDGGAPATEERERKRYAYEVK